MDHQKGLEEANVVEKFSKAAAETVTIKNLKTLKLTVEHGMSMRILSLNWGVTCH